MNDRMLFSTGDRPRLTKGYVARPQPTGCLLYHVQSDELYLVPHDGFFVLQLCDGRTTVRDIAAIAAPLFSPVDGDFAGTVCRFLERLAARGILHAPHQ